MTKGLGDILVQAGIITTQQREECITEIDESGQPIERCLVDRKFTTYEDIAQALAQYSSLEYLEKINDDIADLTTLGKVPIHFLKRNIVMPVLIEGRVVLVTANPLDFQPLDELNLLFGGGTTSMVSSPKTILEAINRFYPIEGTKEMIEELEEEKEDIDESIEFGDVDEKDILSMATEAPIIKLVNHILYQACKQGVSDIHIEPFEKELQVRFRVDGVLHLFMTPPKRVQGALISRIKIMADLNIAEKRVPHDGRIDIRIAGKPYDIRVSILPVVYGERVVMRLLDKSRVFSEVSKLGLDDRDERLLKKSIEKPNGIIYVTGPTGSGKTSTLYSVLGALNKPEVNIITVEDPVEYQMMGIGQVQVKSKIGMTFAAALRSILRQDPDIIMIGETRDQETAQIAVQAALTGHLVLSTLHTNSAPASITRLLDMGVEAYLIASSVVIIVAQRLVRKLCICKKQYTPDASSLESIGLTPEQAQKIVFYEPQGCDKCAHSGYKGRLAIFEIMDMTPKIAKLTMERADTGEIRAAAVSDGMTMLIDDGVRRIKEGITTIDEVVSVATVEHEIT